MQSIFHITSREEADVARSTGKYLPAGFAEDGFIHCSYAGQVTTVASRYYHGQEDLVLLEINRSALMSDVIDENLIGGEELFPHLYGPLPMGAVVAVHPFPCEADGTFVLPQAVQ